MHSARQHRGSGAAAGFTLIELMVVIAILSILAAVVGVNVLGAFGQGSVAAAKTEIKSLADAVIMFKLENGKFPSDLETLINNPKRNYLNKNEIPADPWGNKYVFQADGANFRIISYGADGTPGGDGENADIASDSIK
ncbi:MAG TPA: type II secretion system major pseudopilin GspG [Candidatus Hydrogenedentes bacterium]|nr:type II secretion system major pseudopilin GspG [Candidatus Hydrogenedentota bacterium]